MLNFVDPIPDFPAFLGRARDEEAGDQLNAAVAMARSSLEPLVAPGRGAKDKKGRAILASTIECYAQCGGGTMQGLIELLREPLEEANEGYKDGEKIAMELSELLLSTIRTDPLLGGTGIKKNRAKNGSLLGLLVIGEAKDLVASGKRVSCKGNLIRLAAQARKCRLAMLFAPQAPKSIAKLGWLIRYSRSSRIDAKFRSATGEMRPFGGV